ncbi:MAG: carboxypeptidase regulatory-like domain-containing protein [Myxococcaceae bacterium]|nr:carboxypeptidase regulatory-like domain-containing protein [Myxococcaceae bacterium]
MRLPVAIAVVSVTACGPLEPHEEGYVDHDPGVWRAGLTAGEAGGCDTSIVAGLTAQLVAELNCITPNTMADFRGPNITVGAAVQPYLNPAAASALKAAVAASGTNITLSSAYRSVAQQYLLLKWFRAGQCGIQAAAEPGKSNHQSGRAIDVPSYNFWISRLQAHGWSWYGSGDVVHFDFLGAPNGGSTSVLAFQRLWNKNHTSQLTEDGDWGPMTEAAMAASPTTGFAISGCGTPPMTGTLTGRVYRVNPADPMDLSSGIAGATVQAGGQTRTTDMAGQYTIELPEGTYTVSATASGFATASLSRTVAVGQTIWGSVGLTPSGAPDNAGPELVLVSPLAGARLGAADVTLTGTATDALGTVAALTVAVNGAAGAPVSVSGGAFSHAVRLVPGANAVQLVATDDHGNVTRLDVAFSFATGVDGLVLSEAGSVAGATVDVVTPGGYFSAASAADGTFHFDLLPGPYRLRATAPGLAVLEVPFVVGVGRREEATLTLMPSPEPTEVQGGCGCSSGFEAFVLLGLLGLRRRR